MSITCNTLLHQKFFTPIKLMAGDTGLDRVISWPYVCQTVKVSYWVHGGELLFITGIMHNAAMLDDILEESIKKNLAGLVIITGSKYIQEIPASLLQKATAARFPVFSMPWNRKVIDITKKIAKLILNDQAATKNVVDFLNYLLFTANASKDMLLNRAAIDEVVVPRYFFICIFASIPAKNKDIIIDENILRQKIDFYCAIHNINSMSIIYGNNVILLAGANNPGDVTKRYDMLDEYQKILNREAENTVQTAFGNIYDDISKIKDSYKEANSGLGLLHHFSNRQCSHYNDLGFYRLFQSVENKNELRAYCYAKLQPLFD